MSSKVDGRIVIDTEIDVSGAREGVKNLTSEQIKIRNEYRKTAREIALLQEQIKEMETPKIDTSSLEKYETKLQETYDKLADLEAQARAIENEINASVPAGTSEERLQNMYEHNKAWKEIQQAVDKAYIEAEQYEKEIEKIKNTKSTEIGTLKYRKAVDALANATEHLEALGKKTKEVDAKQDKLVNKLKSVGREGKKSFRKASSSAQKFAVRLRSIIASAFIFNIISSGLRQLTEYMGNALKTNKQFSASMSAIKGNLLTAFQPIYNAVMPALNSLMSGLQRVTGYIAGVINKLFGTSIKASQESAKELYEQSSALNSVADSAKKANKQLAYIDELHVVNKSEGVDSAANNTGSNIVPSFGEIEVIDELPEWLEKSIENIKKLLGDLKIGDYFAVGEDVSNLVIGITKFFTKAINNIDWYGIGQKIGDFFNGIDWGGVIWNFVKLATAIITAIGETFAGIIDTSPILGGLLTLFAGLKLTGLDTVLSRNITSFLNKKGLSIGKIAAGITLGIMAVELIDSETIGESIVSLLASATGGYMVAGPAGVAVALAIAIPLKLMFVLFDGGNVLNWNEIPLTSAVQELVDEVDTLNNKYTKFQESAKKPLTLKAEYEDIRGLLNTYFDLSKMDYNSMTDAQKIQLKTLHDKILEYAPKITANVNSVTSTWQGTSEELQEAIDKQYEFYLQSAYSDIYSEAIRNLAEYQSKYREIYTNEDYQNLINEQVKADKELETIRNKLFSKGFSAEDINQLNHGNILLGMDKDLAKEYINAYNNSQKIRKNVLTVEKSMKEVSDYFENTREEAVEIAKQMGISYEELELMKVTDFITFEDFENNVKNAENTYNNAKNQVENNPVEAEVEVDTTEVENAEWTWQDFLNEVENNPVEAEVEANTIPAIDAVNMGVSAMNVGLGLIKTPNINANTAPAINTLQGFIPEANSYLGGVSTTVQLNSATALDQAWSLRDSIEAALSGIDIGLEFQLKAKVQDTIAAGFNIGQAIRMKAGEIKAYRKNSVPYLASGAVIPPNKEFMAVLGDQKHGMNIEAPAELIKQMVKEGIAESGTAEDKEVNVYVYLEGDAEGVFNLVRVENDRVKKQTGDSAFA